MKESNTIKFAVVGAGHIGKRHATMIQSHTESQLVALCDILPEETLALETFEVPFFQNIEALLAANLEIDVVCICTPNCL
jgi:predicted dehydrogenase